LFVLVAHPELGAPAGGIRAPIARVFAEPARGAQGKRAPRATRSHAQGRACAARAWRGWRGRDLARSEHVGMLGRAMGVVRQSQPDELFALADSGAAGYGSTLR
jgi:hypothetical protein